MRKVFAGLALITVAFGLTGCGGESETVDKSDVEQPETRQEKVVVETRQTLPLPTFPDYPSPVTELKAGSQGEVYFSTKSPYDFTRVLKGFDDLPVHTGKGTLILPENASSQNPVPAMVILHGSGGIKDGREFTYAEWFADNGIAGFVVDYYAPRGVTSETPYVMKTMAATEVDIIADAYAALQLLGSHPAIDSSRIGVTGYSYGGMATRYTLDKRIKDIMAPDVPPFALHMDIYGPCHQNTGSWTTTGSPYLAIFGNKDNSVDPETCAKLVGRNLQQGGSVVEQMIIDGAGHAWENSEPISEFGGAYIRGCQFSWHPETGVFLVNGKAGRFQPETDMTREERAYVRSTLGELVGTCIGQGYTVGNNPGADAKSKAKQLEFMRQHFELNAPPEKIQKPEEKFDAENLTVIHLPAFKLPKPAGTYAFEAISPVGTRTRTTLIRQRIAPSGEAVATLQIDNADSSTLMDMGFQCSERKYTYLQIETGLLKIDQALIEKVHALSNAQLTAFERGEALQSLKYSDLEMLPPEDVDHYRNMMNMACGS